MKLNIVSIFMLVAFCLAMPVSAQVQIDSIQTDISLRTVIPYSEVPLNREVEYHVELRWRGELSKYRIKEIIDPGVSNLIIRGKGSSNRVTTDAEGRTYAIKRVTYYFVPQELGMAYVDGVTVNYEDTELKHDESLLSGRIGVKIIDPVPEPVQINYLNMLIYILLAILVSGIIILFFTRYRRRREEEQARLAALPRESIEEKYSRLLKETIRFSAENIRDAMTDLSSLVSGYLAEKYQLPPGNLQTDDLLDILHEKGLEETSLARLKEFYRQADLVKFAGETMTESDFHQNYDTIELILQHQKNVDVQGDNG